MTIDDEKQLGVLQCYRCGRSIDQGDDYFDIAMDSGECPEHEDYLDISFNLFEEYFCGDCGLAVLEFARRRTV